MAILKHPDLPGVTISVPDESVWHHEVAGWVDANPSDVPPDYGAWTKDQLAEVLAARNLPKSGTKDELVARLEEADAASVPAEASSEADDSPDDQTESG
jgi:SAP domain